MTHTRRGVLALAGTGLAALAGCASSGSESAPSDDEEEEAATTTQVQTTDGGVTVRVLNRSMSIRSVRVAGVGEETIVSLSPGGGYNAGTLYAPVEGELDYDLTVYADGEVLGERTVTVPADPDLKRLEAVLGEDDLSWNEVRGTEEEAGSG